MKPATWTHGDLEQSSPGARMRASPPACDPAHPACVPSVTAPPSPQATTDQAGPPPDNTDSCSSCSQKPGESSDSWQRSSLSATRQQLSFSKLTHPTAPFAFFLFSPSEVSACFIHVPSTCKLQTSRHLKSSATHCLNGEASDYKPAQLRSYFFLFHSWAK